MILAVVINPSSETIVTAMMTSLVMIMVWNSSVYYQRQVVAIAQQPASPSAAPAMVFVALPTAEALEDMDCVICLGPLRSPDDCCPLVYMLSCAHYFHVQCIKQWWEVSHQCPFQCEQVVTQQPVVVEVCDTIWQGQGLCHLQQVRT
jgi:Ring finger domain